MNLHNTTLHTTVGLVSQFPQESIPEVSFAGRSNVGKSSIINCLLNRKKLAYVGSTPGKTRVVNFYNVDDKIYLVDLPGYGYARVSNDMKQQWAQLVQSYLTRKSIKLVALVVDIRHRVSPDDIIMKDWLSQSNIPYVVIATKSDKIPRSKTVTAVKSIQKDLGIEDESSKVIVFSCTQQAGKKELWGIIGKGI